MTRQQAVTRQNSENILGGSYRRVPFDLIAVLSTLVVTSVILTLEAGSVMRVAASVVMVCFLPGYVTTAALFPSHEQAQSDTRTPSRGRASSRYRRKLSTGITLRERAALAIGLSVALVPIVAISAGQFMDGFTTWNTYVMIASYVTAVGAIAAYRWFQLAAENRFVFPLGSLVAGLTDSVTSGSRANRILTIALVCSILLAGGVFTYAAASPMEGEQYADFHLLTTDEDGEYVSAGYPEELTRGESAPLSWGIQSYEDRTTEYTVVIKLERVENDGDQLRRIETAELDRMTATVDPGERVVNDHEIAPSMVGENLRVGYYLYQGEAPGTVTEENAYRNLHIWIDVEPAG